MAPATSPLTISWSSSIGNRSLSKRSGCAGYLMCACGAHQVAEFRVGTLGLIGNELAVLHHLDDRGWLPLALAIVHQLPLAAVELGDLVERATNALAGVPAPADGLRRDHHAVVVLGRDVVRRVPVLLLESLGELRGEGG